MTPINFTADGTVNLDVPIGAEYSFAVFGTFGGGTIAAKFPDGVTTFRSYVETTAAFTTAGEIILTNCGTRSVVQLALSGSTDPNLNAVLNVLDNPLRKVQPQ
jgi:hypothetical protein